MVTWTGCISRRFEAEFLIDCVVAFFQCRSVCELSNAGLKTADVARFELEKMNFLLEAATASLTDLRWGCSVRVSPDLFRLTMVFSLVCAK